MDFCSKLQLHQTFILILLTLAKTMSMISASCSYSFQVIHPHALRHEEPNMVSSLHSISAPVVRTGTHHAHLAILAVGTPPTTYHLHIDTGSHLTWIQCLPSKKSYNQTDPLFDPAESFTYSAVPSDDPQCAPPDFIRANGECKYSIAYEDGSGVKGILSQDRFTARSANGNATVPMDDVIFGCTHDCNGDNFLSNSAGIMALGRSRFSLLNHIGASWFSFCLPGSPSRTGHLRFGGTSPNTQSMSSTPLFIYNNSHHYYVKLLDITIAGQRLHLPNGTFDYDNERKKGGFIFDTGSSCTMLIKGVYEKVKEKVEKYYEQRELKRADESNLLCYEKSERMGTYPRMVLHFQGADYAIPGTSLFISFDEKFCLFVRRWNTASWLGNRHQHDVRFVYNVQGRRLHFAPELCGA